MKMNFIKRDILQMDATSIAKEIRNGNLTSLEVTQAYITHIKRANPSLNTLVEDRFDEALAEAKEKDAQTGERGALHGVPISIKEAYDVSGMKTTGGLVKWKERIRNSDAAVVKKLKQAGAIILGKTNTPELCFCQETDNTLYGRTNNAWDKTRTAGGSSGGEGALLGVGGAALGIGSDIGGSIRFPSHFNGVIGFKSGKFQVSEQGHFPETTEPLQSRMLGLGPMGKSVCDMELMYNIIAENSVKEIEDQEIHDYTIEFLTDNQIYPLTYTTTSILKKVKDFLKGSFSVEQNTPPYFEKSALLWQEIMSIGGGKSEINVAFPSGQGNVFLEYAKKKVIGKSQVHPYLSWALIGARLFKPSHKRQMVIRNILGEGDRRLDGYLNNRLLIFPVYHTAAPKHGKVYKEIFSIRKTFLKYMPYIAYANVWGLPALTIPVGTDENDMPISIQIMSKNGNESAIIQLGKILEARFRGYIRSTLFD